MAILATLAAFTLRRLAKGVALAILWGVWGWPGSVGAATISVDPAKMPRIGVVDERYQSYNVEMLEVTGGYFWKPYGQKTNSQRALVHAGAVPAGMDPDAYEYRPPIDLANARRRQLAKPLGPAYVRVSGTWANTMCFPASDEAPRSVPKGFSGILTHQQWADVIAFSRAVDAKIVTSFAISPGTRDSSGVWTPEQARRILDYTRTSGGSIAAAEFMNEPNLTAMGGVPKGYDAASYGRDFRVFRVFIKQAAPELLILGPGSVGETDGP